MHLLVVRHAQSVPHGARGVSDNERPLTADGERRFVAAAQEIARHVPKPDVLLTSPLVRARQTAALLAAAWNVDAISDPTLASGSVEQVLAMLEHHAHEATVGLVGHEPTVSALVAELAATHAGGGFPPGGAVFLDIASLARRDARILWSNFAGM